MKAGGTRARRRFVLGGMAGAGVALAVASVSWACTVPSGFTWYSDGTFQKSGPGNAIITAYATQAKPNTQFVLVTANSEGEPGHEGHACMFNFVNINPNIRVSSSTGFIGNTSGRINRTSGTWQICFREHPTGNSSTIPVSYSVL